MQEMSKQKAIAQREACAEKGQEKIRTFFDSEPVPEIKQSILNTKLVTD